MPEPAAYVNINKHKNATTRKTFRWWHLLSRCADDLGLETPGTYTKRGAVTWAPTYLPQVLLRVGVLEVSKVNRSPHTGRGPGQTVAFISLSIKKLRKKPGATRKGSKPAAPGTACVRSGSSYFADRAQATDARLIKGFQSWLALWIAPVLERVGSNRVII